MGSVMVPSTKPQDVEWSGVIAVMAVDLGVATDFTGPASDFASAHGVPQF
jgi:hypothetical protein